MKTKFFNLIARVTAVATIVSSVAMMSPVKADDVLEASDTLTRLKISIAADHDVRFYTPTGVGAASTVTLTFAAGFTGIASLANTDIQTLVASGNTSDCANETYADLGSASEAGSGQVVTVTPGGAIAAGKCVQVLIGTNAHGDTGTNQIINPGTAGSYELTIGGTMDDVGGIGIAIADDDQVTVTANVDPSMSFDLDTTTAATLGTQVTEHTAPYTVDFGTLDPTDGLNNVSGQTLTHGDVNYIHMELDTNATHGAVITIQNANGTSGMVSSSDGVDNISNDGSVMTDDAELYGFCVGGVSQKSGATMTAAGSWASPAQCDEQADGNTIVPMSTTPANIMTIAGPVEDAEAFLIGSADASVLTEAHDDYVDTLTFIATGTF